MPVRRFTLHLCVLRCWAYIFNFEIAIACSRSEHKKRDPPLSIYNAALCFSRRSVFLYKGISGFYVSIGIGVARHWDWQPGADMMMFMLIFFFKFCVDEMFMCCIQMLMENRIHILWLTVSMFKFTSVSTQIIYTIKCFTNYTFTIKKLYRPYFSIMYCFQCEKSKPISFKIFLKQF